MRYLGCKTPDEAMMLSPREYRLMMKACELRLQDQRRLIALQAYENARARSVDRHGRSLYPHFSDFYNPEPVSDPLERLRESFKKGGA